MKRILALILMFGVGSAANAVDVVDIQINSLGPVQETTDPWSVVTSPITPTDEITLDPSQWIRMDVAYTDDGMGVGLISLAMDIMVDGPATLYVGETGNVFYNTLLMFEPSLFDGFIPPTEPPDAWIYEVVPGKHYTFDFQSHGGFIGIPGVRLWMVDYILLHCDAPGEATVTIANNFETTAGGTYNMTMGVPDFGPGVTIIPEPMTISLLGLGGLTLLRKHQT